ncbi:MAG: hypothetical protein D6775_13600 [Caldilineae bacterium]|nr:MAG: hypothetical protein D6775_13600 [Caldilineae bacterium]
MMTYATQNEFASYIRIVLRRWWLILLLPLVTTAVIVAVSRSTPPMYQATTRLQILPVDSQEVSLFSQTRFTATSEQIQTIHDEFYDVLRLPAVSWQTIADLGLNLNATELAKRIDSYHQADFIDVSLRMETPELAQQALSRQVENAIAYYRSFRSTPAEVSLAFLEKQMDEQSQKLADAQQALQQFQLENEVSDLEREIAAYQDLRRSLTMQRDQALIEAERNEKLAEEFRALSEANFAKAEALLATTVVSETVPAAEAERGAAEAAPASTPQETVDVRSEAESLLALARSQRSSAEQYAALAQGYRTALAEYNRILDKRQQEFIYYLGLQERYEALVTDVAREKATYDFLADKANEARLKLSQGEKVGYLQVTTPPRLPGAAVPKNTLQLVAVGILVSLLVAVILAFVLEVLESSLSEPKLKTVDATRL